MKVNFLISIFALTTVDRLKPISLIILIIYYLYWTDRNIIKDNGSYKNWIFSYRKRIMSAFKNRNKKSP